MLTTVELLSKICQPQVTAMPAAEATDQLEAVEEWNIEECKLSRTFRFKNFHQTMAFVNAVADIAHANDHHPELIVSYNRCRVNYDTHSVNGGRGGISVNDFICAAKINVVFKQAFTEK